jgi:ferredoxin
LPYVITIDWERCGGCGDCAVSCPVKLLALNGRPAGIPTPEAAEDPDHVAMVIGGPADCNGCMSCTAVCARDCIILQDI